MKAPATALPWHLGLKQAEQIVYDSKGWAVANATVYHGKADLAETKANAAYISHAANAYPQLVSALRAISGASPLETDSFVCDFDTLQSMARAALRELGEQS